MRKTKRTMRFDVFSRSDDKIFAVEQYSTQDEIGSFVVFRLKVESQSAPNVHKREGFQGQLNPATSSTQSKKFEVCGKEL